MNLEETGLKEWNLDPQYGMIFEFKGTCIYFKTLKGQPFCEKKNVYIDEGRCRHCIGLALCESMVWPGLSGVSKVRFWLEGEWR